MRIERLAYALYLWKCGCRNELGMDNIWDFVNNPVRGNYLPDDIEEGLDDQRVIYSRIEPLSDRQISEVQGVVRLIDPEGELQITRVWGHYPLVPHQDVLNQAVYTQMMGA